MSEMTKVPVPREGQRVPGTRRPGSPRSRPGPHGGAGPPGAKRPRASHVGLRAVLLLAPQLPGWVRRESGVGQLTEMCGRASVGANLRGAGAAARGQVLGGLARLSRAAPRLRLRKPVLRGLRPTGYVAVVSQGWG